MPPLKAFGKSSRKKLRAIRSSLEKARMSRNLPSFSTLVESSKSVEQNQFNTSTISKTSQNDDEGESDAMEHQEAARYEISCVNNNDDEEKGPYRVQGRRIVDMEYLLEQLKAIGSHKSLFDCKLGHVQIINEKKNGLNSTYSMVCEMCCTKFTLKSFKATENTMDINEELVAGSMSIGGGYTPLNTLLCYVNISPMSLRLYQATHDKVCEWWEKTAQHCMIKAGIEEKEHSLAIGNTDEKGTPMISVSGDACWSKRSYGTNYCASSGAGAIVGIHSKKVLYYGVKNKFCQICSRANTKHVKSPEHTCFKNFNGPSTAMEAAIITEGFKRSLKDHGLIYNQYVADGDSSTYSSIRNARPYEGVTVGKIECKNHLLRNYCKGLLSIASNTTYPLRARKLLKDNYLRIRWGVDSSVKYWTKKNIQFSEKLSNIKNDIVNGPYHIFGDHSKCASYFCSDKIKKSDNNLVTEMKVGGVFQKVEDLAHRLSLHAYSFVYNETNNLVESFNARVAKFVGGKRVNLSQRRSYAGRCAAAVVSYNSGTLQSTVHKFIFGTEANPEIVRLERNRHELNVKRIEKGIKKKKIIKPSPNKDAHYGEECQKVDIDEKQYEVAKRDFLLRLEMTSEEKEKIERDTILQSASPLWLETRRKLLTASWFSTVCKRRPNTNCASLVKQILYGRDLSNVPSIKHGRNNEVTALRELEQVLKTTILQCGLSIDKEFSFLGASPDGKCEHGIVEVKCPSSAYEMDPEEAIKQKKIDFWKYVSNKFVVNKKHKWFYQIQGQLRITGQKTCIFAVWTGTGKLKYEFITKDDQFWKENMEIPLIRFYNNCLLPELIDPRFQRNMELREHSSHLSNENVLKTIN